MGDRRNIVVRDEKGAIPIFFYSHWTGSQLAKILRDALLRGQERWRDSSYLNRIIFSEMIKDYIDDTAGFGISMNLVDSNYEHELEVFHKEQEISIGSEIVYSFSEYIELSDVELIVE